jgi:hypothetical protein
MPCIDRAETGEQPLPRDGVLNEIRVAIEVKAKRRGANTPHRDNRRQVAFLATSDERHRRTGTRRGRNLEHDVTQGDRFEASEGVRFIAAGR